MTAVQRAEWRKALAAAAKAKRRQRGRHRRITTVNGPGMVRRNTPPNGDNNAR